MVRGNCGLLPRIGGGRKTLSGDEAAVDRISGRKTNACDRESRDGGDPAGMNGSSRDQRPVPFRDRAEAGRYLATKLEHYRGRTDLLVLALPRGGVPVGFEVAASLH